MKKTALLMLMVLPFWAVSADSEPTSKVNTGSDISNERHRPLSWFEELQHRLAEHWHPNQFKGRFHITAIVDRAGRVCKIKVISHSPDPKADETVIEALNKVVFPSGTRFEGPAGDFQPVALVFNEVLAKRCRDLFYHRPLSPAATRTPESQ